MKQRHHQPSPPSHPRQQEANPKQELIAANIKLLIEQLEAGHSDALTNYLTAMSRFHNYSFGNVLEIARQMPTATRVAGFWTWKHLGRSVKKGEKGIRILAPIVGVTPQEGRGSRKGHHQAEHARSGRLPQCLRLRCLADRRRRPSRDARSLTATPARTATVWSPSSSSRASSLSLPRRLPPRWA